MFELIRVHSFESIRNILAGEKNEEEKTTLDYNIDL